MIKTAKINQIKYRIYLSTSKILYKKKIERDDKKKKYKKEF